MINTFASNKGIAAHMGTPRRSPVPAQEGARA
jgi:hypothetical protein